MGGIVVKSILFVWSWTFDILTLPFYFCIQQPWKTRAKSNRPKVRKKIQKIKISLNFLGCRQKCPIMKIPKIKKIPKLLIFF